MPKRNRRGKARKPAVVYKNIFDSPFAVNWVSLPDADHTIIVKSLSNVFDGYRTHKTKKDSDEEYKPVFGVNSVTKAIENNELSVVVVCKQVTPPIVIQHLPVLCTLAEIPIIPLNVNPYELGTILGFRSCIAIGFKKNDQTRENLLSLLIEKAPDMRVNWLQSSQSPTLEDMHITQMKYRR
eukprot:TRINITY_DN11381_c0_g1_i1.p1 TRINITY_DN11381_c0_g1~~TRINITY_DN11381_c0_g1_i1.p1  ORF type:complete len:182 (-),score=25.25 TRINITY_DN11381_c0_g1_i1:70-615(-)